MSGTPVNSAEFIKFWEDSAPRHGIRGHSHKMFTQRAKLDLRKYSFAVRIALIWNNLPEAVVNTPSVNSFKNRLDKYWNTHNVKYDDFKAKLSQGDNKIDTSNDFEEEELGSCFENLS